MKHEMIIVDKLSQIQGIPSLAGFHRKNQRSQQAKKSPRLKECEAYQDINLINAGNDGPCDLGEDVYEGSSIFHNGVN